MYNNLYGVILQLNSRSTQEPQARFICPLASQLWTPLNHTQKQVQISPPCGHTKYAQLASWQHAYLDLIITSTSIIITLQILYTTRVAYLAESRYEGVLQKIQKGNL